MADIIDERDQARRELTTANARIATLEAATPTDCTAAVSAERARILAALTAFVVTGDDHG